MCDTLYEFIYQVPEGNFQVVVFLAAIGAVVILRMQDMLTVRTKGMLAPVLVRCEHEEKYLGNDLEYKKKEKPESFPFLR
jgi:hypothetical protein